MPLNINDNIITGSTVKMFNDTTILTTGLTYLYDAGLGNSYPGAGTSWNEWVGNTSTATLTNGPTASNEGGGSISFDGSNDYVQVPDRTISPPFTIQMWIKPNDSSYGGLHSHWSGGPVVHAFRLSGGNLVWEYYNGTWRQTSTSTSPIVNNVWQNVAVSVAGGGGSTSTYFWLNGQLLSIGSITGGNYGFTWGSIGSQWGYNFFNGRIAQCANYSGVDIGQTGIYNNYQATRTRFGV